MHTVTNAVTNTRITRRHAPRRTPAAGPRCLPFAHPSFAPEDVGKFPAGARRCCGAKRTGSRDPWTSLPHFPGFCRVFWNGTLGPRRTMADRVRIGGRIVWYPGVHGHPASPFYLIGSARGCTILKRVAEKSWGPEARERNSHEHPHAGKEDPMKTTTRGG